jgi:nicotinamidase-related amidase
MARRALIVVDMLNSYDFEGADALVESAADAVPVIAGLIERARQEGVDVIYVNDNYGHWNSSRQELVSIAKEGAHPELVEPLEPDDDIMFVVKARHSIFYQTPVEFLLSEQEIDHLVLTGQVTEQCILYSALDAYVRDLEVTVVHDAVAHIDSELGQGALELMKRNMNAEIVRARDCRLAG